MSFFGDLVGSFTGANDRKAANAYADNEQKMRKQWFDTQNNYISNMRGPQLSAQQQARLKALDEESKVALEQDKSFQGQMRNVTQGGAQALSSIQNQQAAQGNAGGFANQGSISDVYDRVGGQLANLAQQQQAVKDQKRDTVANTYQSLTDAQIAYENGIAQMRMALQNQDYQQAQEAMAKVSAAQAAAANKFGQNLVAAGTMAAGAMTGNPGAVAGGAAQMKSAMASPDFGPTQASANAFKPYWQY